MTSERPSVLPKAEAQSYRATGCEALVWTPASGVLVSEVRGHLAASIAMALTAAVRRIAAAHPRVLVFHDWEEMTDYDTPARIELTNVGKELEGRIEMSNILLRSRIVALAVQGATLLIPSIKVFASRAGFELALQQALSVRRSPPSRR
jgi:hypothetical protein